MSTHDDLPELPPAIREDLEALRRLEPTPGVTDRAFARLGQPDLARRPYVPPQRARRRVAAGFALAAACAAALLVFSFVRVQPATHEIALVLPSEGSGYIHLPWSLHDHPGDATMQVETHAALAALSPSPDTTACADERCLHEWSIDPAGPGLRVEIPGPGRWHFEVRHAGAGTEVTRTFVVVATRD